jgi:hypothetical protein
MRGKEHANQDPIGRKGSNDGIEFMAGGISNPTHDAVTVELPEFGPEFGPEADDDDVQYPGHAFEDEEWSNINFNWKRFWVMFLVHLISPISIPVAIWAFGVQGAKNMGMYKLSLANFFFHFW